MRFSPFRLFFRKCAPATSATSSLAVSQIARGRSIIAASLRPERNSPGKYPIATKRVLRAILKAVDLCVSDPALIAQLLVDQGYTSRYDYALQALSEIRYDVWRDYDPEDSAPLLRATACTKRD